MDEYWWDSFDCEIQCEEVYEELEVIEDEVEDFPQ